MSRGFRAGRSALGVLAIIILAVALRVGLWWWGARSGAVPPGDPEEYYRAAVRILQGGYDDAGKWLRPPGYPALLALLLPLAGMDVARATLIQSALMGLGALAFYAFGRQVLGRHDVGLLAGLLAALFVPLAAFGSALYAEALFVTLMVLGLTALDRAAQAGGRRMALAAGALLAAATLTRAVGLFCIPLAALLLLVRPSAVGHPTAQSRWPLALALLLGAAVLIGPWAARNYSVHHRLILVDTNGGISVWWGQVRGPAEKAARDAELFAVPNLADRQSLATRWTIERIREDPLGFVGRMRFKVASLLMLQTRNYAAGDLISIGSDGSPVVQNAGELSLGLSLLADAEYILIMLLGIAGLCFAPSYRRALPAVLWALLTLALVAVSIGHPRLRLPLVAALIPFAAYALARMPDAWRAGARLLRDRRAYAALAGAALFLALVVSTRYVTWLRGERYALAAPGLLARGDTQGARQQLELARGADPANALRSIALADLEAREGRYAEADGLYRQALEIEGRSQYARAMRVELAALLGRPAVARAELAAIENYWRAGDDLYRWAWGHPLTPPLARVAPGDPLALGHYTGFAPATPDLPGGLWDSRRRHAAPARELRRAGAPAARPARADGAGRRGGRPRATAGDAQRRGAGGPAVPGRRARLRRGAADHRTHPEPDAAAAHRAVALVRGRGRDRGAHRVTTPSAAQPCCAADGDISLLDERAVELDRLLSDRVPAEVLLDAPAAGLPHALLQRRVEPHPVDRGGQVGRRRPPGRPARR